MALMQTGMSLYIICCFQKQSLLFQSSLRSLLPFLSAHLFPLFLLWTGMPRVNFMSLPLCLYYLLQFSFFTQDSPDLALALYHLWVSFNIIHQSLRNTQSPTFSRTILFQPVKKIVICDSVCELFISSFHLDRTLTLAGLYTATRQSASLLSFLIKTTAQLHDLNQLCQKKHWAAQVASAVRPCSRPPCPLFCHQ